MRLLLGRVLFALARVCQKRGWLIGQWFQNKGILMLAVVSRKDK